MSKKKASRTRMAKERADRSDDNDLEIISDAILGIRTLRIIDLDDEMKKRIHACFYQVWNRIGGDLEQAAQECGTSLDFVSLAEGLCDCEWLEEHGDDEKAVKVFRALEWDDHVELAQQSTRRFV